MHPPEVFHLHRLSPFHQERFLEGKRLFNAEEFWEAHEAWEDVWKEQTDPQKRLIQGLIQAAASYHLICTRPRINGALRNIEKSLDKFVDMPEECFGIRIDRLCHVLRHTHTEATRRGQEELKSIGKEFVPKL